MQDNDFSSSAPGNQAVQRIVKVRRDYNRWVASETLEDYALRYAPQRARQWSPWRVANTAFGVASFLVLEAVGATLLLKYGFANAFWAIVATGLIIFLAGLPISVYAARYGVDMDLLTRGAGFGYIGSTLTSLIYASFTFIFFALEAAVMAYALELALGIAPVWGYLICALAVIPLVTHGIAAISRFHRTRLRARGPERGLSLQQPQRARPLRLRRIVPRLTARAPEHGEGDGQRHDRQRTRHPGRQRVVSPLGHAHPVLRQPGLRLLRRHLACRGAGRGPC